MVDMNVIMLEGLGLYIALAILLFMVISITALAWSGIKQDEKIEVLSELLKEKEISFIEVKRENIRLKLKCGELEVGEKVDV